MEMSDCHRIFVKNYNMETKKPTKSLKIEAFGLAMDYVKSHSGVSVEKPDFKEWYNYFLNELMETSSFDKSLYSVIGYDYSVLTEGKKEESFVEIEVCFEQSLSTSYILRKSLFLDFIQNPQSYEKKSV